MHRLSSSSCYACSAALIALLLTTFQQFSRSDELPPATVVAFGSCNRQNKPQDHWNAVKATSPDLFLWTGDSVYAKNNSLGGLEAAFRTLMDDPSYNNFRSEVPIDGIWDDHDMGINDGGKHVSNKNERQEMFMKYITTDRDTKVNTCSVTEQDGKHCSYNDIYMNERRDGLYKIIDKRFNSGSIVRFILLDTRSHRDNHCIKSLGEIHLPLTPIIAAFIRLSYSVVGLGRSYKGSMLGESQWKWLESVLTTSTADFHVIISSVQILTSNPVVESWSHFPLEKKRFIDLLKKTDPPGLVFLSGDVHHGELSRAVVKRESGDSLWVEVTSSGMTHTCGDSFFNRILCPNMLDLFSQHRLESTKDPYEYYTEHEKLKGKNTENYFIGKNFGVITDVSNSSLLALNVSVIGIDTLQSELSYVVTSVRRRCNDDQELTDSEDHLCIPNPIVDVYAADFPLFTPKNLAAHLIKLISFSITAYWLRRQQFVV